MTWKMSLNMNSQMNDKTCLINKFTAKIQFFQFYRVQKLFAVSSNENFTLKYT